MSSTGTADGAAGDPRPSERPRIGAVRRISDERAYLYEIIQTIGSGPDLETILRGVVSLVTEATACHACFIYFVDEDTLVLRAASTMYAHLQGQVRIPVGEGLTGWVARTRRSAFIKEDALEDPRVRRAYFPELGDEVYESLVSVPIFSRAGEVTGVITLHADAPHEFSRHDLEFLDHTASLVAGAVENARLYEEARDRIAILTELSHLADAVTSAQSTEELLTTVVGGCRAALGGERCELYLLDASERLTLRAADPPRREDASLDTRRLWLDVIRDRRAPTGAEEAERLAAVLWGEADRPAGTPLFVPLMVGEEPLGMIALVTTLRGRDAARALTAVASHAAVAIKRHQLIDWLKETHRVKDFFETLAAGRAPRDELVAQAAKLGVDLEAPHLALHVVPWTAPKRRRRADAAGDADPWDELAQVLEGKLSIRFPGALFDRRERSVRGLLPIDARGAEEAAEAIRAAHAEVAGGQARSLTVGISGVCRGVASFRSGLEEATSAAEVGALIRGEPGVTTYEDLGPYRYVLTSEAAVRDRYQHHLERLAEYDRKRGTRLLETLETYLDRRGNVVATSKALYVHPNTLRQRLARVQRVAGLDVAREDWLSLAIAIKVVKLRKMRERDREEGGTDG